jgi:tRNA dimethylallyltransferase
MAVAERTGAEILSVDSMQVYEGLDVGTAKPTLEERNRVRHHMIDVTPPEQAYTVADFRRDARRALSRTGAHSVLLVGGSGLHFRSVVDPMRFRPFDPDLRKLLRKRSLPDLVAELLAADDHAGAHVDLANRRRVLRSVEAYRLSGITPSSWAEQPEAVRYRRYEAELDFVGFAVDHPNIEPAIDTRLATMWKQGLVEEVERLAPRLGPTASRGVGYRQLLDVVSGSRSEEDGRESVKRATMALVKRQRTFFRRDPRLRWLDGSDDDALSAVAQAVLS